MKTEKPLPPVPPPAPPVRPWEDRTEPDVRRRQNPTAREVDRALIHWLTDQIQPPS